MPFENSPRITTIASSPDVVRGLHLSVYLCRCSCMISILPFAEQLSGVFSTPSTSWLGVLIQTFMAGLGTAAFSVLYRVPKKYFLDLGTLGAGSWLLYLLIWNNTHHEVLAILFPALLVTITSRFLAHYRRCPAPVFLASSCSHSSQG